MVKRCTLDLLLVGDGAIICDNAHFGGMRRRLFDMGFTPNTFVRCVGQSPGRDMKAYSIRGSVVALRLSDAGRIYVKEVSGGQNAVL